MNEKAYVSKELNAKHMKILDGLVKLPENRKCADCQSKGPRWASVNLGVFICLQCSGIHRSLGVHISKVRSTTLDTWLPEQVAFMQSMGNEKANTYWEAELPPNFDRKKIENYIRAKYQEKEWVSKKATHSIPIPISGENMYKIDKFVDSGTKSYNIPKKKRKFSLDEEIFTKHMAQVAPSARTRAGSVDMMNMVVISPPKRGVMPNHNTSVQKGNGTKDLFSLLYAQDSETGPSILPSKAPSIVPSMGPSIVPSRWATFE